MHVNTDCNLIPESYASAQYKFLNTERTVIGYERTVYTTPEGNRTVELCARVFSPACGSPRDIEISATTQNGTAGTIHQSLICLYCTTTTSYSSFHTEAGSDFVAFNGTLLMFPRGTERVCHTVTINQDDDCEVLPENESFFSDLSLVSSVGEIIIQLPTAEVIIEDREEPECG